MVQKLNSYTSKVELPPAPGKRVMSYASCLLLLLYFVYFDTGIYLFTG